MDEDHNESKTAIAKHLEQQIHILGTFLAIFWGVQFLNVMAFGEHLNRFGIYPRHLIGLRGVFFAPFIHGSWGHLIANTIPFLILGWLVMVQETSDFFVVTLFTMVIGGVGTWFIGRPSLHIGASILIFGYFGFLIMRGFFQRNIPSIALALLVFFLYGSMIWGVLPSLYSGISWEGHLCGFLGGTVAAWAIGKKKI